jgi:hypothetical protein
MNIVQYKNLHQGLLIRTTYGHKPSSDTAIHRTEVGIAQNSSNVLTVKYTIIR